MLINGAADAVEKSFRSDFLVNKLLKKSFKMQIVQCFIMVIFMNCFATKLDTFQKITATVFHNGYS